MPDSFGMLLLAHDLTRAALMLSIALVSLAGTAWLLTAIAPVWFRGTLLPQLLRRDLGTIDTTTSHRLRAVAGVFAILFYAFGIALLTLFRPH